MRHPIHALLLRFAAPLQGKAIIFALLSILPFMALSAALHNADWEKASIVAVSVLIGYSSLKSSPLLVLAHGVTIVAGFFILFQAIPNTGLFVTLCAVLATMPLLLSGWDRLLRPLGTWTVIPVLYAALETNVGLHGDRLSAALHAVPYMLCGVLPAMLIGVCQHYRTWRPAESSLRRHLLRAHHLERALGDGLDVTAPLIASAVAVGLCAWLVEKYKIPEAQWFVWSAASVITGEFSSMHQKMKDRIIGAVVGVPLGIALGLSVVPASHLSIQLVGLFTALTLVGFQQYRTAFMWRCAGHALLLTLIGGGALLETSRLLDVVAGGMIGLSLTYAIHFAVGARVRHGVR